MAAFRSAHERRDAKVRLDERDAGGERVIAGRRSTGRSGMSETDLRRDVARDLEVLMNTVNLAAGFPLGDYPRVRRSVLNHGFPDVMHRTIDESTVGEIGQEIEAALALHEPRLVPGSIAVSRDQTVDAVELKIRFVVRADLRYDPINVPVEFLADIERDTGKITIKRS